MPAIVTAICLLDQGSGKGTTRTHIQKFVFLAEKWGLFPAAHRFSLYLHGPYSRDLDGEIMALCAASMVRDMRDSSGFGATYRVSPELAAAAGKFFAGKLGPLETLAESLAPKSSRGLEAIATSEYVRASSLNPDQVKQRVKEIKPHLTPQEIDGAYDEAVRLRQTLAPTSI